ncbi:portal protein [Undibacterium sp. TJN19]|uniref:portal protein n=1 Tax=Undibacterium sp. TJN19 TaxID=3413055 RepID=UPI003BF2012B
MGKGLTQDELKTLVMTEMRQSLGYSSSKLSHARQKAEYYYLGMAVGDLSPPEVDGRSAVVSTDVRDTIESMLPQLMVTFCGGDSIVEFEAQNPDDEARASAATEYINYLFFKKNNGHKIAYTWMKDALLQKNGIVKVWWDTRFEEKKEEYKGLSQVELAQILDDEEIEVTEQNAYPDEDDAKQRQEAIQQLTQQMQQAMQEAQQADQQTGQQAAAPGGPPANPSANPSDPPGSPGSPPGNAQADPAGQQNPAMQAVQQLQAQLQQIQAQPPQMLYDLTCKRVKKGGKIQIDNVPPEEFLIARNARDIQTAKFVGHRVQRTVSELKSMGYKNVDNISGEDQGQAVNMERIQRLSWNDENAYLSDEMTNGDESQRQIWITEAYVRCDFDGDGISELRKVTVAGNEILDNEEVDFTPFVDITPVPLPHTFFGLSIADLAMESQKTKTSILRSQLDNLYLNVNGRYYAVEGQVNLDDLLTSRPGGVVRIKQPGAVGRLDQAQGNTGETMGLLDYIQQDLENKTGWTRYSQGNDGDGLNQTAQGMNIITNKADMRLDLIARNFAEGFTELFKYVLKLMCQHQDKKALVRLSNGWTDIDPREWRNQFDVSINVGIGLGNKDQKVNHLMALLAQQEKVFPLGIADPQGIYQSSSELAKLLGFKNGDKFFTDPAKAQPQAPKPDPQQMKAQADQQQAQMQMQADQQKTQMQLQADQQKTQMQMQADQARHMQEMQMRDRELQQESALRERELQLEAQKQQAQAQNDMQERQHKAQLDAQLAQQRIEFDRWKAQLEAETKIMVAQITARQKLAAGNDGTGGGYGNT